MTARIFCSLVSLAAIAIAGCGSPPPVMVDASQPDAFRPPTDAGPPECAPGTEMCGDDCVDTDNSREHCGGCGTECAAGEACVSGDCTIVCPEGQAQCDGACWDTLIDRNHCGTCETTCDAGEICVNGFCELTCPTGQTLCGTVCVDTQSNPAHCGACDDPCAAGEVCSTGMCAASCGAGLEQCGGACVSTQLDPMNCGACGEVCPAPASATAFCMGGTCRAQCAPLTGDCDADLGSATSNGCERSLASDVTSCGACGRTCDLTNAVAGCSAGACVIATCDIGFDDCDSSAANGCETDVTTAEDCGACGNECAAGQSCVSGMCRSAVADTCATSVALTTGTNTVAWTAFTQDYLVAAPSCGSGYAPNGPDVVLSYTATTDERVTLRFPKPADTRWHVIVSTSPCGTITPALACISDWAPTFLQGSFNLTAGTTAYVYVVDTTSGTLPLSNPLTVEVSALDCALPTTVMVDPPNGSTTATLSPVFTATFGAPVTTNAGVITITGSAGTSLSYDLATAPTQVTFTSSNTVMRINPGITFPTGETLTISWTGVSATTCTAPVAVPAPTWVVSTPLPSCAPGTGGVVGNTPTRLTTDIPTLTEYYVAADESPTGWVYVGGTTVLYRIPKTGGTSQAVHTLSGAGSSQLGYTMLIDGLDIYTVDDTTTAGTARIFRISTDGGATWAIQNYASFATNPSDDFRAMTSFGGRMYLVTEEDTDTVATEIWSVPLGATSLPAAATLELSIPGEGDCSGLARDASFFYLACDDGDRVVRVPTAGGTPELITSSVVLNATNNELHGDDTNGDGVFDVLYVHADREEVHYVCSPATAPFVSLLLNTGTGTTNYGLGFDRTANVLWTYDDDTPRELVRVQ